MTTAAEAYVRAGHEAFIKHGEAGELECPYEHGPPYDERRTWWFDGFLAERTRARLKARGMTI